MNIVLRGKAREVLEKMVKVGYANTFSEAVRLAVINFGEKHLNELLISRKLAQIDKEIKQGKRRVLTAEEALGEYAKYLK